MNSGIEIRQDLIADQAGQKQWADRLARIFGEIEMTLRAQGLFKLRRSDAHAAISKPSLAECMTKFAPACFGHDDGQDEADGRSCPKAVSAAS